MNRSENEKTGKSDLDFLTGGGEMGQRIRAFDWSRTPLGPAESWPQSLKTAIRIMLTSRQPIWLGWGESLIKLYNDPYRAIVGGKHPSALAEPASVVWREIWDEIGPMLETAMGGVEGTYVEEQLLIMERHGYREETYYTFSYSPIPNDQGGVGGIICANTDDTQRVIGERQLALLRELAAKTANARTVEEACSLSADCLLGNPYDLPFAMIYLLEPGTRRLLLTGRGCGIERGQPAAPAIASLDSSSIWPFAEVLSTHQAVLVTDLAHLSVELPTGAWPEAPHQAVAVPISSRGGAEEAGVLVVGLNPYRLYEEKYRGFLELVAAQIASSIANAQAYEHERKRAEALAEIDRAKTLFFSNVSHEFRTPLTLMLGPIEDLLQKSDQWLSSEQSEKLEIAHRNSLRLLKLVNSLLDFSRIESGRIQAVYEPCELSALTADLASLFRSAVERAGLKFIVDCPPLDEQVYVDREMWEKIVLNLVSNAFKFTFEGAIEVSLAVSGEMVNLQVKDTGTGIPADEIPHLFERFHRVRGARGRTFEGSGIGLALILELVRLHGGTVSVESSVGLGSTFKVAIPRGRAHLPQDRIGVARTGSTGIRGETYVEEALGWIKGEDGAGAGDISIALPRAAQSATGAPLSRPRARILIADDNADMRSYLERLLGEKYEVAAVDHGRAALDRAREQEFDLVITDVMMPVMDGFELLKELRADERLKTLPVILLSARAGEEARIEGMEAGTDDYLVKPFNARELLARVETHLALARLRREAACQVRQSEEELRILQQVGTTLASNLDLRRIVQAATDAGRELSEAEFGAFFYNIVDSLGEKYMLYTLSGAPLEAFEKFELPRNTCLFGPTFAGEATVRIEDVLKDPRYGRNHPYYGMPPGHLPVRSYLAVPVISRSGEVLGGLFYGHHQTGVFSERSERLVEGIARQAAIAIDNARLYEAAERARSEAQESAERLRAVFNSSVVGVAVLTLDEQFLETNAAFSSITGYSPDELRALRYPTLCHPDDYASMREHLRQLIAGEIPNFVLEDRFYRADGRTIWVQNSVSLTRDTAGGPANIILLSQDITESKHAEEALRESEAELRLVASHAPVLIAHCDREGRFRFVNDAYAARLGLSPEEMIRKPIPDLLGREAYESIKPYIARALEGERVCFEIDVPYERLGVRTMYCSYAPEKNAAGEVQGWVAVVSDVTERKQAEEALESLLLREQAARRDAEEASRLKDEFLATVSHELRTPLNAILGWAQMLQLGRLDQSKNSQAIETIYRNARSQAQLIEDLLDVSRIITGKMRLDIRHIHLAPIIHAAIDSLRPAIDSRGIRLYTLLNPDVGFVLGDPNRLQQMIWNLLSNAVKFTPQGGRIEVTLERVGEDAQISVSDTGRGISSDFLPYVFDRFRQADSTSTRRFGGLGLGLSIVRHLAELHGGTVQAMSPGEGRGATFVLRLPQATDERHNQHRHSTTQPHHELDAHTRSSEYWEEIGGLRVLLVDDEQDTVEMLGEVLRQCGAEVRLSTSTAEALATIEGWRPDILVSDIAMPGEDGYSLIRALRARGVEGGGDIPAIALTAYVRVEDRIRVLSAGFQMHVPKPVEPTELLACIASLAGRSRRGPGVRSA